MTDFKAKMHQIRFRLGLCPRPHWGSLQRFPRPPSCIYGPTSKGMGGMKGEGKGREGKKRGWGKGRGKAPHKCWNLGPQLPCYATGGKMLCDQLYQVASRRLDTQSTSAYIPA